MLLRTLPDPSSATAELRQWFDARWGQENCIVLRRTAHAEFGPRVHTLSIRAAWGGMERCYLGGRAVGVDDDNFLILNHGRSYSTSIRATLPMESLAICFRPELVERACAAMLAPLERALDQGDTLSGEAPQFPENLQPHDKTISPVLRYIKAHVLQGVDDEEWYEEQLHFLLERMQIHRTRMRERMEALELTRTVTRREVFRRIGIATDLLHTSYAEPLDLNELARVACLSKYHFLRLFTLVHRVTPISYLQIKRTRVALRLLRTTRMTVSEIAAAVGFARRTTVLRQIRRWTGVGPLQIRAGTLDGGMMDRLAAQPLAKAC
jgi:AraC family transcriptional regulator